MSLFNNHHDEYPYWCLRSAETTTVHVEGVGGFLNVDMSHATIDPSFWRDALAMFESAEPENVETGARFALSAQSSCGRLFVGILPGSIEWRYAGPSLPCAQMIQVMMNSDKGARNFVRAVLWDMGRPIANVT